MSAPARPPECPDPRTPVPDDPELRAVEDQLAAWLAARSPDDGLEDEETRVLVRALVTRLQSFGCPPEMMILHLKKVFVPLAGGTPLPLKRAQLDKMRDTLVRVAIEEYFGSRRPAGR